jgi:23S rRNA (guanosine2251-2'-O)-methyltransferase
MIHHANKRKERPENKNLIYGLRAVMEAVLAGVDLNKICIQKGMSKDLFLELKSVLKGKDYHLQFVPVEKLDTLVQGNHQGVVAFRSPISYVNIEDFVEERIAGGKFPTVLALDRVTDVRNFGGIARTAECMGADVILVPSKGSALVTSDAVKTSAGSLNRIPVAKTDDLKNTLFYLQQCGMRCIACTEKTSIPIGEVNLRGGMVLLFGSEENGISNDLLNMADVKAKIPMVGSISSLNVGVSVAMVMYEKMRQESAH